MTYMKNNTFSLILLALAFLLAPLAGAQSSWLFDLAEAQKLATEQGKDMLIIYRGVDPQLRYDTLDFLAAEAQEQYVTALQSALPEKGRDGRVTHPTFLVFADAQGRPYYCAEPEWQWGWDWLLEEMNIASERREAVAAIWQEMQARPAGQPEWPFARRLFEAMPVGIERFHGPYRALLAEAIANGDQSQPERVARQQEMRRRANDMLQDILLCRGFEELAAYAKEHEAELQQIPTLMQAMQVSLASAENLMRLSSNPQAILTPEGKEELLKAYEPVIALAPGTKVSRFIRTQGAHQLHSIAAGLIMAATCKQDPEKVLEAIAAIEAADSSLHCQQALNLLRGRVYAEMGLWEEAQDALELALVSNPQSPNAQAAAALALSLWANEERLAELLPLRRQGNAEVDAEWDELLKGSLDISVSVTICDALDDFYAAPPAPEQE